MQYYNSFFQQSGAFGYVQKPAVRPHPQTRHPREQTSNVVGGKKKFDFLTMACIGFGEDTGKVVDRCMQGRLVDAGRITKFTRDGSI